MLKILFSLIIAVGVFAVMSSRRLRWRLMEELKALSDLLLLIFLRATSRFGSELTRDGLAEQKIWREQRLRDLKGLGLRSRQRWARKKQPGQGV